MPLSAIAPASSTYLPSFLSLGAPSEINTTFLEMTSMPLISKLSNISDAACIAGVYAVPYDFI